MNKNKRRVGIFILISVVFFVCFSNCRSVIKIQATPKGNVYFSVDGLVPGSPEFKFYFDQEENVIKVIDRKDGMFLPVGFEREEFLKIKIFDFNGKVKSSISLLGGYRGTSTQLNDLEKISFEDKDSFEIVTKYPERIKVEDHINGFKGFDPNLGAAKFLLNKKSITAVYIYKPEFSGIDNITIEKGSAFNPLEGVGAISIIEGDLTDRIVVEGNVDTNKAGEYNIKYSVTDIFNTVVEEIRTVIVKEQKSSPIGKQIFFNVYGEDENTPEFKVAVDKDNKIIRIVDRKDEKILSNDLSKKRYINISLFNKNDKEKISVNLMGNDKGSSSKLSVLDNYSYEEGDYLRFFVNDDKKITLTGDTGVLRPYYFRIEDFKFNLTAEGIKVEDTSKRIPVNFQFTDKVVINKGEDFDPLKDVIATNEYDEEYISKIKIDGSVNTNIPGEYVLKYSIVDGEKYSMEFLRTIIVDYKITQEEMQKLKDMEGVYPQLKIENHKSYFRSMDRKVNKFIISFEKERNENQSGRRIKRN